MRQIAETEHRPSTKMVNAGALLIKSISGLNPLVSTRDQQ